MKVMPARRLLGIRGRFGWLRDGSKLRVRGCDLLGHRVGYRHVNRMVPDIWKRQMSAVSPPLHVMAF